MSGCLSNLLPSSVLAYNNSDLLANGKIPVIGTTSREIRPVGGRAGAGVNLPVKRAVRVLPTEKIYAEFYFAVKGSERTITITNPAGGLAGGAGGGVIDDILITLGSFASRTETTITFHTANAETKINREITLTAENFFTDTDGKKYIRINTPSNDYVFGVLGVTLKPINFASPSNPLTSAQIAAAKALSSQEIRDKLGRDVNPDLLTDSDIRVLLNIDDVIDELASIGASNNEFRGWRTVGSQVEAQFIAYNYTYVDAEGSNADNVNLFERLERDPRKTRYRSDNTVDGIFRDFKGHAIYNGTEDDATDKVIIAKIKGNEPRSLDITDGQRPQAGTVGPNKELKVGDKVYVSYVGGNSLMRHCIRCYVDIFIIPFVGALVNKINNIAAWTYKKYRFILPRTTNVLKFTVPEYLLAKKGAQRYVAVEGQRLVSTIKNFGGQPYVIGCYYMDINGFSIYNFRTNQKKVVWPLENIGNQDLFLQLLDGIIEKASYAYLPDKSLDIDVAIRTIFSDFLFDVSEITNSLCTDNQKYAYEGFLADTIKLFPTIAFIGDTIDRTTFIAPKLDLVNDNAESLQMVDIVAITAVDKETRTLVRSMCIQDVFFDKVFMQGAHILNICNVQRQTRVSSTTVSVYATGDVLVRTPIFQNQKLTVAGRIYVESFGGHVGQRDPSIFVGTTVSNPWRFSVATDAYKNLACLSYMDIKRKTLRYRLFDDFAVKYGLDSFKQYAGGALPDFGNYKVRTDDFIGKYMAGGVSPDLQPAKDAWSVSSDGTRGLTDQTLITPGFNIQFGEKPAYYNGKEPDLFLIVAKAQGYIAEKEIPVLIFEGGTDSTRLIDPSLGSQVPPGAEFEDKYTYYTVTPYLSFARASLTDTWKNLGKESTEPVRMRRLRIVAPLSAWQNELIQVRSERTVLLESGDNVEKKFYKLYEKDLDEYFNSTISLVFPYDDIVIDQIPIRGSLIKAENYFVRDLFNYYTSDYPLGEENLIFEATTQFVVDIQVDVSYARLLPFQIRGPALLGLNVQSMKIWLEDYVTQSEYEKITIESTSIATCFDGGQQLYIFYEDKRANQGLLERTVYSGARSSIIKYDGVTDTMTEDQKKEIQKYAFFSTEEVFTEISCLTSPDLGETWYDYKAIIRTMAREQIGNPIAVADHDANLIHLFYNLNGNLMHKLIDPYDFDARDTFFGYIRPQNYQTVQTPINHGLYHFSERGKQMRSLYSTCVIENVESKFIEDQIKITEELKKANRSDYRIANPGNNTESNAKAITGSVDDGKELLDCFVYRDKETYLNLVYAVNGKLYIRRSGDNGMSWSDIIPNGIFIHKNVANQEYRNISNIGFAYDESSNKLVITYFADNMLFYRSIEGTIRNSRQGNNLIWSLTREIDAVVNRPYFVTGKMSLDVLSSISTNSQFFIFPYDEGEQQKFAESTKLQGGSYASSDLSKHIFGAQELASKGYSLSNGSMRFFYIDEWDNIQAYTIFESPVLDVQASQFFDKNAYNRNKYIASASKLYKFS